MRSQRASFLIILFSVFGLLAVTSAPRAPMPVPAASAAACSGACTLYLPLVAVAPPIPRLDAPANAAQLGTIAPILTWTPQITGTYQIQASTDSAFATYAISATTTLHDLQPAQHVLDGNLSPTTTYYWRVGVFFKGAYLFSPAWSFTTSAKNSALLPPRPQLLSPPDHTTLPAREVTVSWRAVPNALYYRIKVYDPSATLFTSAIVGGAETSYHIAGLAPGTTYSWKVKALNQYGWGTYPTPWYFTAP